MHIGISTSVIQGGKTGIAQYLFSLLGALQPSASSIRFSLFVLEADLPFFEFARGCMELHTVPETFRAPVKNIFWHQAILPKLARALGLDVLHTPSYRRLLWRQPCSLVATIHDLAPFKVNRKYDWKRMFYGRVVVPRLARRQNCIIAISRNTAQDIQSCLRLPPARVTVIHNGIDHARFHPGSRTESEAYVANQFGICGPFLLYVARLEHPGKNHVRLISAFEKFKARRAVDWKLVFAGGDWHGADVIHAAIRQSPVTRDIITLGFVPDQQLPHLYRAASGFVYPSLYEGFGLPPLEAMACGCPVISSTAGSLSEVLGDAALMISPANTGEIADQICRLADDPDLGHRLRAAGLVQAAQFDWARTAAMTLEVYHKACSCTSRPMVTVSP